MAQLGRLAPYLTKATPYAAKAGQWLASPLNRAMVGGGLGVLTNNEGTIGGKVRGGIMGAGFGAIPIPGAGAVSGLAMKGLGAAGLATVPGIAAAVPAIASAAVPAAGLLLAGNQSQGSVAQGAGQVAQGVGNAVTGVGQGVVGAGALNMQNQPNMQLGQPVPGFTGVHGQWVGGPMGGAMDQLRPDGLHAGLRLGSGLDTMQNISNANRWFESRLPQWDEVEKRNMQRQVAAKQLGANIELAKQMAGNAQISNLNIARDQTAAMGNLFSGTRTYY